MKIHAALLLIPIVVAFTPTAGAQYTYDITDSFPTSGFPNHSVWTGINGNTLSDISGTGVTNANVNDAVGGSLISNYGPSAGYEVKETLTITDASDANFVIYLRAAQNALITGGSTAPSYALVLANVQTSTGGYTAQLCLYVSDGSSTTLLHSIWVPVKNGSTFRGVVNGTLILGYVDDVVWMAQWDSTVSGGYGGVGLVRTPRGNGILNASIGHLCPNVIGSVTGVQTSPFANRMDMHWTPPTDSSNGTGIGVASTSIATAAGSPYGCSIRPVRNSRT